MIFKRHKKCTVHNLNSIQNDLLKLTDNIQLQQYASKDDL